MDAASVAAIERWFVTLCQGVRMRADEHPFWQAIGRFEIDDGEPALTFTARLARENRWSDDYARRVIEEYRRFVFLAMVTDHVVSPSKAVDQVWHLHLTYTRSYWQRLCGEVLGRPLHHEPTRGGHEERSKYRELYSRTLESYRRYFGDPPTDIWPSASRPRRNRRWAGVMAAAAVAMVIAVPGCINDELEVSFWWFVVAGIVVLLLLWLIAKARRGGGGGGGWGGCGGGCISCGGCGGGCGGGCAG